MATNIHIATWCAAAALGIVAAAATARPADARPEAGPRTARVPILMYHRIGAPAGGLTVDPRTFAQQMRWLHRNGYRTLTQRQLYDALALGKPLPPKPVLITLDDGYDDVLRHAAPVLERLGMRATAYVITSRSNDWRSEFLTWFELRELERRGIEIASHTVTHRDLRTLGDRELNHELVASRRALERRLGHPVRWLAYPFGGHDGRVVAAARRAGYLLAVTTVGGVAQNGAHPLELRRVSVTGTTGVGSFASMLGG